MRVVGRRLAPAGLDGGAAGRGRYEDAPCCVLAHDTAADPRFTYANKAAQRCFEYPWTEFAGLPSRLSAEAPNRVERQALLDKCQAGLGRGMTRGRPQHMAGRKC